MTDKKPELQMPKWLLYSLIAKDHGHEAQSERAKALSEAAHA